MSMPTRRRIAAIASICSCIVIAATAVLAAPASLDVTFGGDGKVMTNFTDGFDGASAMAIQADGKIVAAGVVDGGGGRFALSRYETDGSLDPTFGGDGRVTTNFGPNADAAMSVAIQADGKIVAAGEVKRFPRVGIVGNFALARYNTDGTLDTTFGGDGKVTTSFSAGWDRASGVAIQSDGKIVAAGSANASCSCSRFALSRYDTDGVLDSTFGGDGRITTPFRSGAVAEDVAIQADGKIVVVGGQTPEGSRFRVARYKAGGALDGTFSDDGKVLTRMGDGEGSATAVAIQANGKILVTGYTDVPHEFGDPFRPKFALARYRADGRLDPNFSGDGRVTTGSPFGLVAEDVEIQGDGRIVAVGHTFFGDGRFALVRYMRGGGLDDTFGGDGRVTTNFTRGDDAAFGVGIQADGKIVAAGHAARRGGRFALSRYLGG
jgi:uncharacterized delta-60 repeat protein